MRATTFALFNAVFLAAALLVWPIYQDFTFVILVAVSLITANAIALVSLLRNLRPRTTAIITAGAYLILGIPLAVPSAMTTPGSFFGGVVSLFTAPVTAWKDLLTLSLPVGSYQTVLIPALLLFLVVPVITLLLALSAKKIWWLAAITVALPMLFGATFGSSATSENLEILGFNLLAPRETLLTLFSLLLTMFWLSRRRARSVQRRRQRWSPAAVAVIVASVLVAVTVAPLAMSQSARNVLRTQIDPKLRIDQEISPLSLYRRALSNELFNTELFQVSQAGAAQRVRIATLTAFDGQVATVSEADASLLSADVSSFARVPSLVDSRPAPGATSLKIGALQGIWMPTIAQLTAITFSAPRPEALSDGFFYNPAIDAGIQLADGGLKSGDTYRLEFDAASNELATETLDALKPGLSEPRIASEYVPESLQDWIAMQNVSRSGEGLQTLIDRLRARGYLSHALTIDAQTPPLWMTDLPGYEFEPSRAGHSSARIDQLFTDLRDRQREVGAASDAQLVAAVGDDEQFAVAAMLLADQLGFNARVVVGTKLVSQPDESMPACASGLCTGSNLTAWLEVQGESGQWVSVDVTPQFKNPLAPEVDRLQDPQVVTEAQPPSVDPIEPPDAAPSQSDAQSPDVPASNVDLEWLWLTLRIVGMGILGLLIILGPFALIMILKQLRQRWRRRGLEPKDMVLGAWNEYVDTAIDFGKPVPHNETRTELARLYSAQVATENELQLAEIADRAVFDIRVVESSDSIAAWSLVDARARELRTQASRRERVRAAISLRSFWRWVKGGQR